jgi:hypothetical protein
MVTLISPFSTNVLGLPLLLLAGFFDLFVSAATLRCVLANIPTARDSRAFAAVCECTDPVAAAVRSQLSRWTKRPVPAWLGWAATLASVLAARQLCLVLYTAAP